MDKVLKWCVYHKEPVWMFNDGSWRCWWLTLCETGDSTQCKIIDKIPDEVLGR